MDYRVEFVDGEPLPGHRWALVRTPYEVICFFAASGVTPEVIAEAWEGYRHLVAAFGPVALAI